MESKVMMCTCAHKAQDELHGKQRRVCNPLKKGTPQQYRCTVCSAVKSG